MRVFEGLSTTIWIAALRLAAGVMVGALGAVIALGVGSAAAERRALCVHDVPDGQSLTVRAGPGARAAVVGEFRARACGVRLVGRCDGDWCEMALGDKSGWVDTRFIGIYEIPTGETGSATAAPPVAEAHVESRPSSQSLARPPAAAPPPALAVSPAVASPSPSASVASRPAPSTATVAASPPSSPSAGAGRSPRPALAYSARPIRVAPPGRGHDVDGDSREPLSGACVVRVEKWDTLRIRRGPGVGHAEIGDIPAGACRVEHIGGCRGDWCRVAWRGRSGWVNTYYLD